jgi:hypothetical protein
MEMNRTHHLLVYADNVNILGEHTNTTKKNTEALLEGSTEVGLEVITEKTKYMFMSCHQNGGQNCNFKTADKSFKNVAS